MGEDPRVEDARLLVVRQLVLGWRQLLGHPLARPAGPHGGKEALITDGLAVVGLAGASYAEDLLPRVIDLGVCL